jgi:hypothetical protein
MKLQTINRVEADLDGRGEMAQDEGTSVSALLLCADEQVLPVAVRMLDELSVFRDQYGTSASAAKAVAQSRFELFILDLDLAGADHVLGLAGSSSAVIALSKDPEILQAAARKPVHFVWKKPVPADLIFRDIKAACGIAKLGRRPDYRIAVDIRASVSIYGQGTNRALGFQAITNLSASGLCLKSKEELPKGATISLTFQLPESKSTIHATGKVIWAGRDFQSGVHFSFVPAAEGEKLRRWVAERTPLEVDLLDQMIVSQMGS